MEDKQPTIEIGSIWRHKIDLSYLIMITGFQTCGDFAWETKGIGESCLNGGIFLESKEIYAFFERIA
jgi:hypothetical protein